MLPCQSGKHCLLSFVPECRLGADFRPGGAASGGTLPIADDSPGISLSGSGLRRFSDSNDNCSMEALDWDDPIVEERWCAERRIEVTEYLARQRVEHGEVGSWPAWHVVPYVSIWAIESLLAPGAVGWWAICGDLPTDYISASNLRHPRKAVLAFADTWREAAGRMINGVSPVEVTFGPPERTSELAPLLQNRANLLRQFAEDDSVWGPEYD